jgi:hypothetical protein
MIFHFNRQAKREECMEAIDKAIGEIQKLAGQ